MASTDLIAPIIVAIISLVGSFLSVLLSWHSLKLTRKEIVSNLTDKYSHPIIIAAYDLQQRLFDLVEYPISRQHLEKPEGLQDLKKFTCYLLARYLVAVHIMRTNTGYLCFSTNPEEKALRKIMYLIDEELDRRRTRDQDSKNIGVWPAARILIAERMIIDKSDVNSALDGGFGYNIKGLDLFLKQWDKEFKEPMGYFCETIDMMVEDRIKVVHWCDCALRVLQHLLVDLVKRLDPKKAYVTDEPNDMKCEKSMRGCDCDRDGCGSGKNLDRTLLFRQNSRWNDPGLWPKTGLDRAKYTDNFRKYDPKSVTEYSVEHLKKMSHYIDID